VLGHDVQRVARDDGLLDLALAHAPSDNRALQEIGPELREYPADRDLLDAVPRTADALEPTGDRLRRLDLDHEVDRAHVDAELERRRGDQARELAGLQELLHHHALLVRQRAVVGAGDLDRRLHLRPGAIPGVLGRRQLLLCLLVGELVQPLGQALGAPAVVDEDDRRGVLADELQELRVDRRPDRAGRRRGVEVGVARKAGVPTVAALLDRRVRLGHVLNGNDDLQVELLALAGVGDLAPSLRADQELRNPLQGALRGGEADPLRVRSLVGGHQV
jgi:hypothetical protein